MAGYVLSLDQGTTSSRAILFGHDGTPRATAQHEFPQIFPRPGHVEHDPEAIWSSQLQSMEDVLRKADVATEDVAAIGITNQRETTVLWDRDTGKPVANAIVWQSRVSAPICNALNEGGYADLFREKTGLVIDAYFSGTKIKHLLDTINGLRERAAAGEILFGTIDSFLLWRLTNGNVHATDYSNASRTLLYNIHELDWDDELLQILDIPRAMLPEVQPSSGVFGETATEHFGRAIPIAGIAGDQQAATFGQACFSPGMVKNTYGTGCFVMMNTGDKPVPSQHGLLTTIGWGYNGEVTYCLEGAIFIAGAVVQWLRDGLQIVDSAPEVESLAQTVEDNGDVYFVPAFVGLGAPQWDAEARGTLIGITRGTERGHIARAAIEAMAYQTRDVVHAMEQDSGIQLAELQVDGGAAANNLLMQFQSDQLGVTVHRPVVRETTALGAAYLAGLAVDFWNDTSDVQNNWALDREFRPSGNNDRADILYERWQKAVERSKNWAE